MNENKKDFVFEQKAVKYLAELINESGLHEVEYKSGSVSIRFTRSGPVQQVSPVYSAQAAAPSPAERPNLDTNSAKAEQVASSQNTINSPIVGRIYLSPKPGAEPFVKAGSKVEVGQIILIVEAMKVMNNVKATKAGIVDEILVEDAQAVEYDQPLLRLKD